MCTQLPMYADAESKSEELAVVHLKKTTLVEMLCIIKILKICPNLSFFIFIFYVYNILCFSNGFTIVQHTICKSSDYNPCARQGSTHLSKCANLVDFVLQESICL